MAFYHFIPSHVCVFMCLCVYVSACLCVCVSVCIHALPIVHMMHVHQAPHREGSRVERGPAPQVNERNKNKNHGVHKMRLLRRHFLFIFFLSFFLFFFLFFLFFFSFFYPSFLSFLSSFFFSRRKDRQTNRPTFRCQF